MVDVHELLEYEKKCLDAGYKYICGVDEVGRGPLAGPVTCTAVIMPLDDLIQGVLKPLCCGQEKNCWKERMAEKFLKT